MNNTSILILSFLLITSCNERTTIPIENESPYCQIDHTCSKTEIGNLVLIDSSFATYDSVGRIASIVNKDYSYGDTTIFTYSVEYLDNGEISKVYIQDDAEEDIESSKHIFLKINYENDLISKIIYTNYLIQDIKYESGKIIEHKYSQHFDHEIDTFRTRLIKYDWDNSNSIKHIEDVRIADNWTIFESDLTSDSLYNPLYRNVLSLVPECDMVNFVSPHNFKEDNSKKMYSLQSREIIYNDKGYPIILTSKYDSELVMQESIIYNCN